MRNLLIALLVGVATSAALYGPGVLKLGESIPPGVLATMVAYFLLARRSFKQVEKIMTQATSVLQSMPPKFDLALAAMHRAYGVAPYQFGVRSQVDTQIGMLHFLQKDFGKALPYLQRSLSFGHWLGGAMLAVIYYKKKDHQQMRATLETVKRRGKGQSLAWNLYAYLLCQIGDRDGAQRVLVEGLKKTKEDPKVKDSLLAIQNGRKIKMRGYKEQWYQFHLERPPSEYQQVAVGARVGGKAAHRGRW